MLLERIDVSIILGAIEEFVQMLHMLGAVLIVCFELLSEVLPSNPDWVNSVFEAMISPPTFGGVLQLELTHCCLVFGTGLGEVEVVIHLFQPLLHFLTNISPFFVKVSKMGLTKYHFDVAVNLVRRHCRCCCNLVGSVG